MSKMSELHIDILDGDAEALQIALAMAHESARPKEIYLLMDGNTIINAFADKEMALFEAHFCTDAANIIAGQAGDVPSDDFWVKTVTIDYTPFDWLDGFEREQSVMAQSSPDSNAQLDLFYDIK